jgi:23S rRNA (uracil1939-C5)-methyltransferase
MLNINDVLTLDILDIANGGDGIAKLDNFVVFVPYACVGDKLKVRIKEVKRTFARGEIVNIVVPSKYRVDAPCKYYYKFCDNNFLWCGGCDFMHINYDTQLEIKEKFVRSSLEKIAKVNDYIWEGIVGSPKIFEYRNKLQFPMASNNDGNLCLGFFVPRTHKVVSIENCIVQPKWVNKITQGFVDIARSHKMTAYNEATHRGEFRHLIVRTNQNEEVMLIIVGLYKAGEQLFKFAKELGEKFSNIKSIFFNRNPEKTNVILGDKFSHIYGDKFITENINGINYRISPGSFFQTNSFQIANLYDIVKKYIEPFSNRTIIDLYCGSGGIGLYLAKGAHHVIGVEEVEQAVQDARLNAELNGIKNVTYYSGKVEELWDSFSAIYRGRCPILILNPPRTGVEKIVIKNITDVIKPENIIYVSCNPATLARDVLLFKEKGYKIERAKSVDMFPNTSHVETVVKIVRG